jgi:hypothetical protein
MQKFELGKEAIGAFRDGMQAYEAQQKRQTAEAVFGK